MDRSVNTMSQLAPVSPRYKTQDTSFTEHFCNVKTSNKTDLLHRNLIGFLKLRHCYKLLLLSSAKHCIKYLRKEMLCDATHEVALSRPRAGAVDQVSSSETPARAALHQCQLVPRPAGAAAGSETRHLLSPPRPTLPRPAQPPSDRRLLPNPPPPPPQLPVTTL